MPLNSPATSRDTAQPWASASHLFTRGHASPLPPPLHPPPPSGRLARPPLSPGPASLCPSCPDTGLAAPPGPGDGARPGRGSQVAAGPAAAFAPRFVSVTDSVVKTRPGASGLAGSPFLCLSSRPGGSDAAVRAEDSSAAAAPPSFPGSPAPVSASPS
uniref:Uncharacterized protein n=1 Tax=Myotis myotis TaxID=51298 RepID=A0A7J7XH33_MYOMY|nr:hypothetical protein mMyoMyo1_011585 [Myotis myotis]